MTEVYRIKCGMANSYLLKDGGNLILVDTGVKGSEGRILKALKKRGLRPEDIGLIILTHGHADHAGGANYFRDRFGTKIAMHPSDIRITERLKGIGIQGRLIAFFSKFVKPLYITHDIDLYESMRLDNYGIKATVIILQGHTKGSAGILLEDRSLIAGDTLMNFLRPSVSKMAEDFVVLNKSAIRLKMLGIRIVYPGHGKPFKFDRI